MSSGGFANRTWQEWLSSLPAFFLLLGVIAYTTSADIHAQLLKLGQSTWDSYFDLRNDPQAPTCDPSINIDAELARLVATHKAEAVEDEFGLFDDEPLDTESMRESLENSKSLCQEKFESFESIQGQMTTGVIIYRTVERFVADVVAFGLSAQKFILAFLVLICAATATLSRHQIAMRPMESALDHRWSSLLQFIANSMLFYSSIEFWALSYVGKESIDAAREGIHASWVIGFGLLAICSLYQLVNIPKDAKKGGSFGHAMLSVPLYTQMCLISGTYFMLQGHTAGIGVYLDKMMDFSDMFLNLGLYVWTGMMLKETRLASLVFNTFRPFRMPTELLAFVAVVVAAVPTAYTGASGIFVIAVGAVIYQELRRAGARRQLALATTAMSGSMGVVLRPCLLVVIIAYLNRDVTTDELFYWGNRVFFLTAFLFLAFVWLTRDKEVKNNPAPLSQAIPEALKLMLPILPYVVIVAGVVIFYHVVLDTALNEFSAPRILPVMMLGFLVYEHFTRKRVSSASVAMAGDSDHVEPEYQGIERATRTSINETTAHIGALLLLMGLSVSIGGVMERSGVMELFPTVFDSQFAAMTALVVLLVFVGMVMDPYGAVILVNATVAVIAFDSGIEPLHFWMVCLVAFELGYLSPPVALNHLLTRQVVGEDEVDQARNEGTTFWRRHEKILLPLLTMGTALLLVAYVPLWYMSN
ncbi:TRAP transporter large permease subunit [Litoribrevibacter albus]|uniref:Membrane protein n=1 Tax=Litoribrevibacter albus TaxID=1473156 RepID=A0AA37S7M4_9GAMM|nr:TRAP transporter large permease subunit [Litoribrevibacter albus]GLQ29915.1 membrane protein [Litoribrevibacter albus]